MNIKLKALLIAIALVASPFIFLYVLIKYPTVILFTAIAVLIYLVYHAVLTYLEKRNKNGLK